MSTSLAYIIQELADDLKSFNRNDILVNFSEKETYEIADETNELVISSDSEILRTYKKAKLVFRESGTTVFCLSKGILKWEWNGAVCESPILLFPAEIILDKVKNKFKITWDDEDAFLNPFILFYFKKQFDFDWPEIDFSKPDWTQLNDQLTDRGFEFGVLAKNHFGNFHHHRFTILRELEGLAQLNVLSANLQSLFSEEAATPLLYKREPRALFPADNDQQFVFEELIKKNIVVHGPPGTGKSQVLANMLGKNLSQQNSTLVVSEKRVALEVLQQKLDSVGLNRFAYLQGVKANAQSLLDQLKETWQFLESYARIVSPHLPVSKLKLDGLQFKLNVLSNKELIGGVSFLEFRELKKGKKLKKAKYVGAAASIREFLKRKVVLAELFSQNLNEITRHISKKRLEKEEVFQFDEKVGELQRKYTELREQFQFNTKDELEKLLKQASFAQILRNENHKDYFPILKPDSPDTNKFLRWSKKYFVLKKEVENAKEKNNHWQKSPSLSETQSLLKEIKAAGFFQKRKVKKYLKSILKSPFVELENALTANLEHHNKKADFRELEKKLTSIGIKEETEIFWVKDLHAKMTIENWTLWNETDAITNAKLADANIRLNDFYQNIKTYFQLENSDSIGDVFQVFTDHFPDFLSNRKKLVKLPSSLYKHFGNCENFEQLEAETFKSNWIRFVESFPAFKDFVLDDLDELLQDILIHEDKESVSFAQDIILKRKGQFDILNELLRMPARKLTDEQKSRKGVLRKGRSLLIKEFGKTRSHPTIRELLQSEAREWILTLMPIWMVNPAQVGDFFPLEENLFDMAFFDEATQIPLSNALGSLHRSNRAMILGDEHQMSPSNFFKAGDSEPIDLLHQARYNWPKVMLKHHYRSQHPELIDFSNRYFYDNELIAYPNANRQVNPVELHYVKNGVYLEQGNQEEAKALAQLLSEKLKSNDSIGVVAFSETQLKCINKHLSNKDKLLLEEKIDSNKLFFRALENVQGEECDHLLISLGYAKNEEGKLNLNFGPLNRKSGRRRLNVLLSRAKQKIDFFSSIQSSDLSLSDNDSLNLLRLFLLQIETPKDETLFYFPHKLKVKSISKETEPKEVEFKNLMGKLKDANELLTFYRVLHQRGWKIKF